MIVFVSPSGRKETGRSWSSSWTRRVHLKGMGKQAEKTGQKISNSGQRTLLCGTGAAWDHGLPVAGNEEMLSRTQLIKVLGPSGRQLNPTSIKSGFSDGVQNKGWIQDVLMQDKSYQQMSVAYRLGFTTFLLALPAFCTKLCITR